jgi:hypothetical protein
MLAAALLAAAAAFAAEPAEQAKEAAPPAPADRTIPKDTKGAADLVLKGGSAGDVPVPHALHQKTIECLTCHQFFPQEKGAIDKRVAEGKMTKKKVVMKQCQDCHREENRAGGKKLPASCKECHSIKAGQ